MKLDMFNSGHTVGSIKYTDLKQYGTSKDLLRKRAENRPIFSETKTGGLPAKPFQTCYMRL
jgi:hypothetical protein